LLIASMSLEASVSDASGSAGTGTGSRTGSGGAGGRVPVLVPVPAGGVVGRATGGFFFAHAPIIISAIIATIRKLRLLIIVS
jgi:hypothetical protein